MASRYIIDTQVHNDQRVRVHADEFARPNYTIYLNGEIAGIWYRLPGSSGGWIDNMIGDSALWTLPWAQLAEVAPSR